jgi:hypothetical protein
MAKAAHACRQPAREQLSPRLPCFKLRLNLSITAVNEKRGATPSRSRLHLAAHKKAVGERMMHRKELLGL